MKTARHLLAVTVVALTLASPVGAEDKTVPESDFNAYKELAQVKLDAAKESLQKDVAALGTRVDNQDKRIDQQGNRFDDISASIDRFGYLQAGFALIFGLISVGAGFLAAMTFSSRAKAEAEQAAKDWFAEKEASLMQRMASFQHKIDALEAQATAHETSMQTAASRTHEAAERCIAAMQADLSNTQQRSASMSQADSQALKTDAEQLRHKPEAAYTYPDWNIRAFAAYKNGDKSDASYLWRKAAEAPDATALNAAVALCNAGIALGHTDEAIAAYDLVDARYANDNAVREQVAMALRNKGVALGQLGRADEEIAAYNLVDARYADDTTPAVREQAAIALRNKGVALGQLGRADEAIAAYDLVEARYANDASPALREQVAKALVNKGVTLRQLGRADEAIAAYDLVEARYASDTAPALREQVAGALVNKGNALMQLGRADAAIAAYDLVDARYASDAAPALRELVARALFNKGVALGQLGRADEEFAAYDLVEARYANDTALALREQVASALFNKGVVLGRLGRSGEEIAAYELVEARYASDTAPALRKQVAFARNSKGFTLLCRAKADWANLDQRQADLDLAASLFEQAEADIDDKPMVLGNRAYCAHLRGEPVEVVPPLLERALKEGREQLYKGTLDDLAIHPVPEDAAYRVLLDEVWAEVRGEDPPAAAPVAG